MVPTIYVDAEVASPERPIGRAVAWREKRLKEKPRESRCRSPRGERSVSQDQVLMKADRSREKNLRSFYRASSLSFYLDPSHPYLDPVDR